MLKIRKMFYKKTKKTTQKQCLYKILPIFVIKSTKQILKTI